MIRESYAAAKKIYGEALPDPRKPPCPENWEKRESFDRLLGIFLLFTVGYFYCHQMFLCSKFNYIGGS